MISQLNQLALKIACSYIIPVIALCLLTVGCKKSETAKEKDPLKSPETLSEFKDELARLRMNRDRNFRTVERMKKRKNESKKRLVDMGIKTSEDLKNNTEARMIAKTMKDWDDEIRKLEGEVKYYDDNIFRIKAAIGSLERKMMSQNASLSKDEFTKLRKMFHDLNDKLSITDDPLEEMEINDLVDKELGGKDN